MQELTKRQAQVLSFVISHMLEHQSTPSYREIGREFGILSPNGVNGFLKALKAKGYVEKSPLYAHGIKVLKHPDVRPFRLTVEEVETKIAAPCLAAGDR